MTNTYILLRNNKETGPLTFTDLINAGLQPFDLIWIPEKSAAWRYASEITELKKYAPVTEEQPYDRFFKPFMPQKKQETEQKDSSTNGTSYEKIYIASAPLPQTNKIYIDMPVVKKATFLQQNSINTHPSTANRKEEVANIQQAIVTTHQLTNNLPKNSLIDDVGKNESDKKINAYAEQYARKYVVRKQKLRNIEFKKQYTIPIAAIGTVVLLAFVINLVMGGSNTEELLAENNSHLAVSTKNIVNQLNEMEPPAVTNTQHENITEDNNVAAISRATEVAKAAFAPPSNNENTIGNNRQKKLLEKTTLITESEKKITLSDKLNNTVKPEPIKKRAAVVLDERIAEKNERERNTYNTAPTPVYEHDAIGNAVKMGGSNERTRRTRNDGNMAANNENNTPVSKSLEVDNIKTTNNSIVSKSNNATANAITLTPNNYTKVAFGGIRNLHFTIANNSKTTSNDIAIEVNYIKSNKEVVKTYTLKPGSIQPGSSIIVKAPDSNKGNAIEYRLISY